MEELKKYIKDILGVDVIINPILPKSIGDLPFFISSNYNLFQIKLFGHDLLLVQVKKEFTAGMLRKHLDIIRYGKKIPAVAIINQIEPYNRLRLIEKKVPFIITGKQMYLPDLLIDLKEGGIRPTEKNETMPPAAQFLLLYHLQVATLEGINLKGIADKLLYQPMTITRAAYYLLNKGFCEIQGTKEKLLHFGLNKKELWEKAEPLMTTPVKKTIYYTGWVSDNNLRKANITALAHFTDLNPSAVEYYALKPGYIQHIDGANLKNFGQLEGNICIEEWKYNPAMLSKQDYVDPLSLYLCLRDNKDERIQAALEQIIKNIVW